MIKLTEERLQEVLQYLEKSLAECLYLYGDIVRYGLNDPNMTVWYSEKNGAVNAVFMKYFTGSHVFTLDPEVDLEDILAQIRETGVERVSAQRPICEALHERLKDDFDVEYGAVFQLNKYRKMKSPVPIERAVKEDAPKIAALLMTHEMYSLSYREEELAAELANRIETGIGRSYIMRDGDRIIAHDGVNIETDKFAVEGLALVHEDFRNTLYGSFMDSYMINDLKEEGKDLYCMILDGRRQDMFVKLGNPIQARYGKIFKKGL